MKSPFILNLIDLSASAFSFFGVSSTCALYLDASFLMRSPSGWVKMNTFLMPNSRKNFIWHPRRLELLKPDKAIFWWFLLTIRTAVSTALDSMPFLTRISTDWLLLLTASPSILESICLSMPLLRDMAAAYHQEYIVDGLGRDQGPLHACTVLESPDLRALKSTIIDLRGW